MSRRIFDVFFGNNFAMISRLVSTRGTIQYISQIECDAAMHPWRSDRSNVVLGTSDGTRYEGANCNLRQVAK